MPYLPSLVLVVVGVVALVAVVIRVVGSLRHFTKASSLVGDNVGDGVGLLKARSAALGVAFAERRKDQPRVRSTDRGRQEDHRA
ncbi:bacteriophage holin [Umezawaea endophytica]|uniref:Bacteriophage holin n=1 Tax=Umezawaea endophytica TaxID=1654476 RepID=A0A9X2VL39_9PSEU|nr:bacteriophage holin [Umezawaea endophytica]MCS7477158.1 bacteriophage holin [Umezawaea endophytica]